MGVPDPVHLSSSLPEAPSDPEGFGRVLRPRVALELYKYASPTVGDARREADRVRERTAAGYRALTVQRAHLGSLADAVVRDVPEAVAFRLHRFAHYLGTEREGAVHLGLYGREADAVPVGLVTASPFDLDHLREAVPGWDAGEAVVVSRLVTFPWSPPNAASYLLGQLARRAGSGASGPRVAVSYLDPNVGYGGGVYRAVGGRVVAEERKRRYLYRLGSYVTDRTVIERFGTAAVDALPTSFGATASVRQLRPLRVYAWALSSGAEVPDPVGRVEPSRALVGP